MSEFRFFSISLKQIYFDKILYMLWYIQDLAWDYVKLWPLMNVRILFMLYVL